jgi:hypothetical protein
MSKQGAEQTRRVIYMDDETWTEVKRQAERRGLTISAWIRERMVGGASSDVTMTTGKPMDYGTYSSRPFTPVPKAKKK